MSDLLRMWEDQIDFNRGVRDKPYTAAERIAQTKELVLHLHSETDELLRAAGAWKSHRRVDIRDNPRHVKEELIDIFKCWLSLCDIHDLPPSELVKEYWQKSMVVRQRFSQEWTNRLKPEELVVIVDIDNVLADYTTGFAHWAYITDFISKEMRDELITKRHYITEHIFRMSPERYRQMRHEFRISGQHTEFPLMPGAREFLEWIESMGWRTVLLTARPIQRYPNLHGETLQWAAAHNLPYNDLWWSFNKAEICIEKNVVDQVLFAVDDDGQHIHQYADQGVCSFWIAKGKDPGIPRVRVADSLSTVKRLVEEGVFAHVE